MQADEFEYIFENQIKICHDILIEKAKDYARDDDRLHNFKQAAHLNQETLRSALAGFMLKHTVSIYDMIRDDEMHALSVWEEKITDHINYLILLRAVIVEEALDEQEKIVFPEPPMVKYNEFKPS